MDEEDKQEAEDAKRLRTAGGYAGVGSVDEEGRSAGNALLDVMHPGAAESMGVKLLQKMGWRQGQGVGPRVRRKARLDDEEGAGDDGLEHLFAPENSHMIKFVKKSDFKGLGYAGELSLPRAIEDAKANREEKDEDIDAAWSRSKFKKPKSKAKKIKPSFGVGVLNDTGSDDDDPYDLGPKISYNRTIGGDDKEKKKKNPSKPAIVSGANPLLGSRPVFTSKKNQLSSTKSTGFRKCHDGRLPLDGFILAMQALDISPLAKYPPPSIPADWHGKRSRWDVKPATDYESTTEAAKSSTLDPKARAVVLGEEALPGKSIFDFITPAARDKLALASGRADLPVTRGEDAPAAYKRTAEETQRQERLAIPDLAKHIALEALQRGASGWMPYADDPGKRNRYRAFLELKAGIREEMLERPANVDRADWRSELSEFAQAAEVFRPMTGGMASRFTSARSAPASSSALHTPGEREDGEKEEKATPQDPAEEAARMGMYGHLTRSIVPFYPTKLVAKRFGVRPPANVVLDPGDGDDGAEKKKDVREMVPKKQIERMMRDVALRRFQSGGFEGTDTSSGGEATPAVEDTPGGSGAMEEDEVRAEEAMDGRVNVERNEALEADRPGDAVFKAIFGDDSDEE